MENEQIFEWKGSCLVGKHDMMIKITSIENYHREGEIISDVICKSCKKETKIQLIKLLNGKK